ncbi:MAG TPA: M13 family metallopeptidase [Bryobacteraceae bacterium]|nr:M13 family metallopeptidase [Bryobacteraceae bacterium]
MTCYRLVFLATLAGAEALAQSSNAEKPLFALPYSPSLDLSSMDRAVDPCVDFYHYACGAWIKKNPIPADQARWDVYAKLTEENQRFLWGILEEASKPAAGRSLVETEIGDYFHACMDEAAVERAGAAPLRPELEQIAGLKSIRELPALLGRLHLGVVGNHMAFGFGSNQDYADSSQVIAFAEAGGLGLPDRDYYTKADAKSQETRKKYVEHVQKMFELLGEQPPLAAAHARTVMEMETALAKASLTRVDKRDPYKLFHKLTRAQLQALTPAFQWDVYFKTSKVPDTPVVNVTEPAFFKELQTQLKSRSLADWKTYLRWHLVFARARTLSAPFVQANFDFYSKYLRGVKEMQPRWKRCVQRVDADLGEALGQVFVQKTFAADTKQRAVAMTKEIEKAMESEIQQLSWMGEETKKRALEKLHTVVNKIGYPDKWRDYSSIKIAREDYFGNVERATEFESRRELAKIGKPVDRTEWQMTPPTVNAYYDPQMNDINFPAGVLQPPLFDPKLDDAPNYGNTGATIGHELTHGFDDEGRQFDAKGDLKDWWTKNDAAEFEKRAKCVSDQYSQYTVVDDIKINGKLTLGEDVADLGGTLLAYLAWRDATKGQNLQPIDDFKPDQRFFIGMAQWACGDERPESKRLNALTNPHSPDEDRINGVVSNLPEFGRAFSCRVGQPMVRPQPCRVW